MTRHWHSGVARRALPGVRTALLAALFLPASLFAANLDSDPAGTYVVLRGPISLSGRAPLPMDELPEGDYELSAEGPGLATVRGRIQSDANGLRMRSWAGPGALLTPPGMVHLGRGERRGWLYLGAATVSAAFGITTHGRLRDAEDDIDAATRDYSRAVTEDEVVAARQRLLLASHDKADQEELRKLWGGYLVATWVAAGIETWLLTPEPTLAPGAGRDYRVTLPRVGGASAAFRSLIVPGAGQRAIGRPGRGNLFGAAIAVGAAGAILAQEDFLDARRAQTRAQNEFDRAETEAEIDRARVVLQSAANETDDKDQVRVAFLGATAGIYLWNVLDAFLGGREEANSLSWSVSPTQDGLLAAASWSLR